MNNHNPHNENTPDEWIKMMARTLGFDTLHSYSSEKLLEFFSYQLTRYSKALLKNVNPIAKLNKEKNNHHYTRAIGLLLKSLMATQVSKNFITETLELTIDLGLEDKLKNLYPEWTDLRELKEKILRMNEYTFSGLITSFDLSYDADASVSVTLQLTGTSDIYTDVTMFIDPKKKKEKILTRV